MTAMKVILMMAVAASLVSLLAAPAQAAATPSGAARATRDCLRAHGWWAVLADGGKTVDARAPRKRAGYPSKPWYSVAFNSWTMSNERTGVVEERHTFPIEMRLKLNGAEGRVATVCRNVGLRHR